jgi:hypothetical protein
MAPPARGDVLMFDTRLTAEQQSLPTTVEATACEVGL